MSEVNELLRGTIIAWDDAKGYGFIEPLEEGNDVFFHIKQWTQRDERPKVGKQVFYIEGEMNRGKMRAALVRPLASTTTSNRSNRIVWAVFLAFCAMLLLVSHLVKVPIEIPICYIVLSLITFQIYKSDKISAKDGSYRVSEKALHLFGLCCGWPGALVAQKVYRHKTVKQSFQTMFWMTVVVNVVVMLCYGLYRFNPAIFGSARQLFAF